MATTRLYTFIDLFTTNDEENKLPLQKIEIPIIQRDYAQGRQTDDVNRIRERFLTSLYDALTLDKQIKLDFVYGDINENGVLIPLDGQQRLTTLFLLHWYIARHESVSEEIGAFVGKFSYETRYSARTFCDKLMEFSPDFSQDNLSEEIKDQSWMPLDWKHDPTINSMLTMLDDIHTMFHNTTGLWERLKDGCISFYFLSLTDMGLTDDLYIKMNSRGKPLTEFEHFKAEWEHHIGISDKEAADELGRKIDMEWTDLLWPYKGANNVIDDEFVRFYKYLCAVIYYKKYPEESIPTDIFRLTKALFNDKGDDEKMKNLEFIAETFDSLIGQDLPKLFDEFLTRESHVPGKSSISESIDVFEDCCNNFGEWRTSRIRSFSIGRMILLYAFLLYLKHKDTITKDVFARRLRVVNNLVRESEFELRDDRMNALLEQTKEVIVAGEVKTIEGRNTFNALQVQEEVEKQEWLKANANKEEMLNKLEDHPLLNGGMSVVGLDHIDFTDRFYSLFSCDHGLVNRALLTIGDYSLKIGRRYQIGSANFDVTWKSVFHTNKENIKVVNQVLCTLLEKAEVFTNDVLTKIIGEYVSTCSLFDWRYYIIKYDSMRPERYGMYYWNAPEEKGKNSYNILMMLTEKSITGGRNYYIFLKTLYDYFKSAYHDLEITLGDRAYNGDGRVLSLCSKEVHYTDTALVIQDTNDIEQTTSIPIMQDPITKKDLEDRIDIGIRELCSLVKKEPFL